MNTESFVKILRKVIPEEVRDAVKDILSEQQVSHKKVINHGLSLHEMVDQQENAFRSKTRTKTTFSKNEILNDILNETAANADFRNMHDEIYVGQEEYSTSHDMIPSTDVNGNMVNKNNLPAGVISALTKDYSGLMKAINKKKGIK